LVPSAAAAGLHLSDAMLAAIGRMTVAATDLEHLLASIGADGAGGDSSGRVRRGAGL
jgi:hypothetical protein